MICLFLRFNASIRQIEAELDLSYKTVRQRVERSGKALDAPSLTLFGPAEIDRVYVPAGLKGREHDQKARLRVLSTRGRGSYDGDKPPVFALVDRGNSQRFVVPAKSADKSTAQSLLADHEEKPLTVYTDGFRAYDPLENDDAFTGECVVHGDGEYTDGYVHVNTCESHIEESRKTS
ncbi:ISH4 transposase [Natrialba chahannaoensis JCM 10990]|uniref:ISH4 transposase n=1 Tax=Natrialba chahannaoensis JCM 10990 TaxID=1227492 RepID=M0AXU8_9EURY|nr:ISH4 transposase [Natrialba chahannaoensis JCM 10990]